MLTRRQRRTEESEPYWRQRGWQLSAGFLAVAVVLGGFAAVASGGDGRTPAASSGPLSGSLTEDGRPQGCRTDDSAGATLPTAAPKDIDWRMIGVVRVPVSATAGPTHDDGTPWWCFARTATGAVLAAHIITAQMGESGWRTVAAEQLVPGQPRDMFVFRRSTVADSVAANTTDTSAVSTYVGFSVPSCTRTTASVNLLMRSTQGYAATTVNLRWEKGDWKVVPFSDGSLYAQVRSVQNTRGYLLWEA
ncbi:hypothetical protein ACWEQC_32450 [Streptomyces shenzhenensis]